MAQYRVEPGLPHPLGATWDGGGVNFALFSAHAEKVELCLFDPKGKREIGLHPAARIHARGLARLSARHPAGPALRLPRLRPLRPGQRPPLQPQEALDRPLRQGAVRRAALARRPFRLPGRLGARRPLPRHAARLRFRHAEMRGDRHRGDVGRRPPAAPALVRHDHLRGARQGHDRRARGPPRAPARHLRRPRRPARHRPSR